MATGQVLNKGKGLGLIRSEPPSRSSPHNSPKSRQLKAPIAAFKLLFIALSYCLSAPEYYLFLIKINNILTYSDSEYF